MSLPAHPGGVMSEIECLGSQEICGGSQTPMLTLTPILMLTLTLTAVPRRPT